MSLLMLSTARRFLGSSRSRLVPHNVFHAAAGRVATMDVGGLRSSRVGGPLGVSEGQLRFKSDTIRVTFVDADGVEETVDAELNATLLEVAHDNDIEVEGACGGEMACSTCHMILEKELFDKLPEKEEEEDDMLDLAIGLTETSRLGCQVITTKEMDGMRVQLPKEVCNQTI